MYSLHIYISCNQKAESDNGSNVYINFTFYKQWSVMDKPKYFKLNKIF